MIIHCGDNMEFLATLPDNCVDSIVTDPPYGLSFMGKKWDYDVPTVTLWAECLRVLKPGGHLLAFAGTRTQHRMAVRIEDAGFEIRDMMAWVYGSGFPKSLDISKAIDAQDAADERTSRKYAFTEWFVSVCKLSRPEIDAICGTNTMARHWTDTRPSGKQPDIPTRQYFNILKPFIESQVPEWVEMLVNERTVESENLKARKVVGQKMATDTGVSRPAVAIQAQGLERSVRKQIDITVPHTAAAAQWHGWGTALKPALEPITLARKPLTDTVAANVLQHGTGGLNIDGCRAEGGRWPANLLHDGGDYFGEQSRFFYCAKASKADRNYGCDLLQDVPAHDMVNRDPGSDGMNSPRAGAGRTAGAKNNHPTVKPIELMRYLCRLVTPPGGIVLDPFTGSGSTAVGAVLEGFVFFGAELDEGYHKIATARLDKALQDRYIDTKVNKGV